MSRLSLSPSRDTFRSLVVAALGSCVAFGGAFAAESDPADVVDAIQREVQAVFEKSRNAVVRIEAADALGYLSGTGFFVDPNGTLYTSYTVGGESRNIQVLFNGTPLCRPPARQR